MAVRRRTDTRPFEAEHTTDLSPTPPARRPKGGRAPRGAEAPPAGRRYQDFVIRAERIDARDVRVGVRRAPAGRRGELAVVRFPDTEARALRDSFRTGIHGGSGRALIAPEEAAAIGRRLAAVLLPPPVFSRLETSLAEVLRGGQGAQGGLRVRLDLDESLIDLPWEYLVRPDRAGAAGVSGFLLFDPALSLVRLAPRPGIRPTPIEGPQRLNFVGTFWEGRIDGWEVWREFDQLRRGLKPVERWLRTEFAVASDLDVFDAGIERDTAIFHYAGHVDFDSQGRAYCVRELPKSMDLERAHRITLAQVARTLRRTGTRLAVMSACNSGLWPAVQPLVAARIPVVIGLNGAVASTSTIEFSTHLYEALGLGLGVDEAVAFARRGTMEWGARNGLFDWGLFMVYAQAATDVLFPRAETPAVRTRQRAVRRAHSDAVERSVSRVRELDGMHFGEIMSRLTECRVLILGRFSARRLPVLQAIQDHLAAHPNGYLPELFTFKRPDSRDLVEAIVGFAALSRFVIADLSEPRSIPQELQAIVPALQSVPVVPIINEGGREFATFAALARRPNVAQPTVRYRNVDDLRDKLEAEIIPTAEAIRLQLQPT